MKINNRCSCCARPSRQVDGKLGYAYLLSHYLGGGHLLMIQRVSLLTLAYDYRQPA